MTEPKWKFNEDNLLDDFREYLLKTYEGHYARDEFGREKIQTQELIIQSGHGVGFYVGNIIKYADRYGKKGGYNSDDIMKVLHYALLLLYVHELNGEKEALQLLKMLDEKPLPPVETEKILNAVPDTGFSLEWNQCEATTSVASGSPVIGNVVSLEDAIAATMNVDRTNDGLINGRLSGDVPKPDNMSEILRSLKPSMLPTHRSEMPEYFDPEAEFLVEWKEKYEETVPGEVKGTGPVSLTEDFRKVAPLSEEEWLQLNAAINPRNPNPMFPSSTTSAQMDMFAGGN